MPVYMITIHAYRSWTEDNADGYYQRNDPGMKPPNPDLAQQRARLAQDPPRLFVQSQQQFIVEHTSEILSNRQIRLHAISCTTTHLHLVASWFGTEAIFEKIPDRAAQAKHLSRKLKNILATLLSKQEGKTGTRWLSRGASCTAIEDRKHLNHLLEHYLPKHAKEGGVVHIFDKGRTS